MLHKLPGTEENKKVEIEISLLIYNPMWLIGFPEGSLEMLQNGEKLSKELGDKKSLSSFYSYTSIYYAHKGNPIEGVRYSEPLFYEFQINQDIELMAPLSVAVCTSFMAAGDFFKILEIAPEVISLLEKTKKEHESFNLPHSLYSWLCSVYGGSCALIGNFKEGKIFIEKALSFAIGINDIIALAMIENQYGIYCVLKGKWEKAVEHCQKCIRYCEEGNYPWLIGMSWAILGYGYYMLGDLENAKKQIEKGLKFHKNINVTWISSLYQLYLSYVHYDLGELYKAQNFAEEALELAKKNNDRHHEGRACSILGRIMGKRKASKSYEAEEYILKGMKISDKLRQRPYLSIGYFFLGELYANTGRKDEAITNLNKALSMCQEMGIEYWPDKIREVLDRL